MKCQKCGRDFPENEIQLSHDIPKYIGGTDKDGRHYLCKKHHDIYEKEVFAVMVKYLPEDTRQHMKLIAKRFAKRWFNGHPC